MAGIPDLRATLDADITVARERADARVLAEMLSRGEVDGEGLDEDLLRESWTAGDHVLNDWLRLDLDVPHARMVLDVGCGSGVLLEAAARRWPVCVGVDTSLRRLIMARHRLQRAGVRARLVCANVDALPFVDGLFDRVIAESVLELSPRRERALREWNRVLGKRGRLWVSTTNRWSVNRDPQPGIPAPSWLPMQVVDLWAKWHGLRFQQRALVGTKRLRRLLQENGFSGVQLAKPVAHGLGGTASTHRSGVTVGRKSLYDLPIVRGIAKRVAPVVLATAEASRRVRGRVAYDRYMARQVL